MIHSTQIFYVKCSSPNCHHGARGVHRTPEEARNSARLEKWSVHAWGEFCPECSDKMLDMDPVPTVEKINRLASGIGGGA